MCGNFEKGDEISSYIINRGISKSWNKHVKGVTLIVNIL